MLLKLGWNQLSPKFHFSGEFRGGRQMHVAKILGLLIIAAFASGTGCTNKKAPAPSQAARVSATTPYVTYFGPAPTTNKGTCYAFVIYFPSATNEEKVVPFPFFTFDETSMKKVALETLIGGIDEKRYPGQFQQLFPPGTRLVSLKQEGDAAVADFTKELEPVVADPKKATALFNAVALTLKQFSGISNVRIDVEGKELFPTSAAPSETIVVMPPSPPRLLKVVASKESAAAPVTEVDALFDRPVDMKRCTFTTPEGVPIKGDVYHSMFDMAAILKPKEPAKLAPGTRVKVTWDVADKVGRAASGEEIFALEIKVHQD
jgi:germination protein M